MASNISYRSGSDPDLIQIRSESDPVGLDQIFSDSDSDSDLYMKSESDPQIINCIIDPDLIDQIFCETLRTPTIPFGKHSANSVM